MNMRKREDKAREKMYKKKISPMGFFEVVGSIELDGALNPLNVRVRVTQIIQVNSV